MLAKLRDYIAEPIIKLLLLLVFLMVIISGLIYYANFYVIHYYEEPAREQIANLDNKEKLGQIIYRQLLHVNADYRRMLLTQNLMQREQLYQDMIRLLTHTKAVLQVLRNGGTIIDVQLVNFYDKDEIIEEISWQNNQSSIPIDVINIEPKLVTLEQLINKSYHFMEKKRSYDKNFDLQVLVKQTDSILSRLQEDTNKIYFDISQSNKEIEKQINNSRKDIYKWLMIISLSAKFLVLLGVFIIAKKILTIISKQKQAEIKLNESNHSLTVLVDSMPFGILLIDRNKNIKMVNKIALEMMDYNEQEILGQICHQKICSAQNDNCPYWDQGHSLDHSENIILGNDGRQLPVLKSIIPITLNNEELLLEAFVDISIQKENELEIKKLNQMNEGLLQSIPIPFVIIAKDERLLYANEQAKILMNKEGDEKKCWQWLTNDKQHCDAEICPLLKELSSNQVYSFERSDILGAGIFQISAVPIIYMGQDAIMELFFDITQEKKAQESLQHAKDVAEQATRAKSEFLASMSHEIRTPMNAIIGFSDMMLETEMTSEQKEYIHSVNRAGNSLLVLINDILDFSKIIAGKMDVEYIGFDLIQMIEQLILMNNARASKKGLELVYEVPSLDRKIISDPHRLQQILTNLIGNAIKFTEKGKVSLIVEIVKQLEDAMTIDFTIKDTGIGVPKDRQKTIFESFSQADGSTTRNFGGTGLGLTISNKLIALLGGTSLTLISEPGKGTSFSFRLSFDLGCPCSPDHYEENKDENKKQSVKACHILLVEDNLVNIKLATVLLEKQGHTVISAKNGQLGVEAALNEAFDLCFMDMQMPVMDGLEATKAIRKHQLKQKNTAKALPIIAMTANAMKGDRQECFKAGMNDYISKPIKLDVINKAIVRNL